jgi:hypothetical protein
MRNEEENSNDVRIPGDGVKVGSRHACEDGKEAASVSFVLHSSFVILHFPHESYLATTGNRD